MSIGPKRWIEYWLDSVSERGYQSAFVTALALDKFEVLHSTSHGALEAGKDVIARKGARLNAYQLKGQPGGRYTTADWHTGYDQIVQLASMPVSASIAGGVEHHYPVLVTNGHVHEAVFTFVEQFNYPGRLKQLNARALSIMGRGPLLELLTKHAEAIWPTTLSAQRIILRMLSSSGDEEVRAEDVIEAVLATLNWDARPSKRALRERVLGAILITNVMLGRWMEAGNLFEVIKGQLSALGCVYSYLAKNGATPKEEKLLCDEFCEQIRDYLHKLAEHVASFEDRPLSDGNILAEFGFYHQRKMMLLGLLSTAALHQQRENGQVEDTLWNRLQKVRPFRFLEGEYIIPSVLCLAWALHHTQPGRQSDAWLLSTLFGILHRNMAVEREANLPSPYYGLTEVTEFRYAQYLGNAMQPMARESFRLESWFAYPLFLMIVRRNWKAHAKGYFRDLTHFVHKHMSLGSPHEFGLWRSATAAEVTMLMPHPREWRDVVEEATALPELEFPGGLASKPDLLAAYCIFFPYRATPGVIAWLDQTLCRTWYHHENPRPSTGG